MSELKHEFIVEALKREALGDPQTGWLSDLARRGLTWDERNQIIVIGDWFGSVDVGHLAEVVERLAEEHANNRVSRVESLVQHLESLALGDKHYARLIKIALYGDETITTNQEN